MPNSHHQETNIPIYPIHIRVFEDFLGEHDFIPFIGGDFTTFEKGDLEVKVPHLKKLSKNEVVELLIDAELSLNEFENYYKHLQVMPNFDELVDISFSLKKDKKTPPAH